jgi:membrane fusion protein (multidrug efflux system)
MTGLTQRAAYREGTLITPNVNGLLTTVSVIDPIWVLFSVSDNQLLELRGEQKSNRLIVPPVDQYQVRLTLADGSAFPEPGQVNFTSPTFDPTTGTMTVRSTFPNPEGVVRPGQFVRATVSGAEAPNTIVVPQTAVSQSDAGAYVFVVENGTAHQRVVELGPWYKDQWIVNEGLKPGDVVIASGANRVQEGSQVTTTTAP